MNTKEKQVEIVRIGSADYPAFSALLEWASSGSEAADTDRYQTPEVLQFMQRYQVLDSDRFFFYAARVDGKLVAYINAVLIPKPGRGWGRCMWMRFGPRRLIVVKGLPVSSCSRCVTWPRR